MEPRSVDPIVASLNAAATKERALERVLHDKAGLRAIQDPSLLHSHPRRAVFEARQGDTPVIVKWLIGDRAPDLARGIRDETARVHRQFQGRFHVAKCLWARPGQGILVFEYLSGSPLRTVLGRDAAQRAVAIEAAGVWHRAYTGDLWEHSEFGPWFWVKQRAAVSRAHMSDEDRALYQAGLEAMKSRARVLVGAPVLMGAIHWDFAPQNFFWFDGQLQGFDVGPLNRTARSRAAAHFLTACRLIPGSPVSVEADLSALAKGDPSLDSERDNVLPFFLIERLLERFLRRYDAGPDRTALRAALLQMTAT